MGEKGCPPEGELPITIVYLVHCLKETDAPSLFGEERELISLDELRDRDSNEADRHANPESLQDLYPSSIDGITIIHGFLEGPVAGEGVEVGITNGEGNGPSLIASFPETASHLLGQLEDHLSDLPLLPDIPGEGDAVPHGFDLFLMEVGEDPG